MLDFVFNQLLQGVIEIEGSHEQFVHLWKLRYTGETIERLGELLGHGLPAGEKAKVGVNLGCRGMIIAGSEVGVAANSIAFAAHDKSGLGVCLQPVTP